MAVPVQTSVAELIDGVVNAFGPFVIPIVLFVLGTVGYALLVAVGRAGLGDWTPADDARTVPQEGDVRRSPGRQMDSDDVDERCSSANRTQSGDVAEETSPSGRASSDDESSDAGRKSEN